ncbi:carbamoyltransferase HypF [Glycomyces sp. L485]|uniref:carbamoyltransferase HypF n=1 Tax=Glycomyces sp. L485 TaxID=2909235 RepID=UPI001F4A2D7E|nr:carbamoyltransferase HypF [Glycomyces sp. L485]MCH7230568.1 carbamoyltransferase HypF [Glycomyces sp. L485]
MRTISVPDTAARRIESRGVTPDLATCDECLAELFDRAGRRYRYPFLDCSSCGPRASVIEDLPYDRERTTMRRFAMCPACREEYEDPADRRFHAETIACPACGPRLSWRGGELEGEQALAAAVRAIEIGGLVAVKGIGGYQLVCDATNEQVISRLRGLKARPAKPMAVMVGDIGDAKAAACLTATERDLLLDSARPIVLADSRRTLSGSLAPGSDRVGLFLPCSPLHHLLVNDLDRPLVVTGAHLKGEPMVIDDTEAASEFGLSVDGILAHDRPIAARFEESVAQVVDGRPRLLRRARGYAPAPPAIRETAAAHDPHPDHLPTQYAGETDGTGGFGVQHHHAHVVACAAEHGVRAPFVGVAYDGLGYGADGSMCGGEIMVADYTGFQRTGRIARVPMPGGERAVERPARMAMGYLFGPEPGLGSVDTAYAAPFLNRIGAWEVAAVRRMIERDVNCPKISSTGRLFDAAASLLGLCDDNTFEGEAAMRLEAAAGDRGGRPLPWQITEREGVWVLDPSVTLQAMLADARTQPISLVAARFHASIVESTAALVKIAAYRADTDRVCLGGGVFANRILAQGLIDELRSDGFEVHLGEQVPPGNDGLAYGQAAVLAARLAPGGER